MFKLHSYHGGYQMAGQAVSKSDVFIPAWLMQQFQAAISWENDLLKALFLVISEENFLSDLPALLMSFSSICLKKMNDSIHCLCLHTCS